MEILIATIILILIILVIIMANRYFFSKVITRSVKSYEFIYDYLDKRGHEGKRYYEGLKKEEFTLTSKDGLKLKGVFIEGDKELNKTMIFVHGITVGIPASVKYIKMFVDRGWSVLMFDQRRHGESEGKYSTFGYYEREDLDLFVNWLIKRKGNNEIIGLHGESMGAATVLMYADINKYAKFIIADCGYSDMRELLKVRMKDDNKMPSFPFMHLSDLRARRLASFKFKDVSPIQSIKDNDIPVLFIHGREDKFVPTYMSEKMYEAKKGYKKIYIAENAKHAEAFEIDKEKYEQVVFEFVNEVL